VQLLFAKVNKSAVHVHRLLFSPQCGFNDANYRPDYIPRSTCQYTKNRIFPPIFPAGHETISRRPHTSLAHRILRKRWGRFLWCGQEVKLARIVRQNFWPWARPPLVLHQMLVSRVRFFFPVGYGRGV